MFNVLLWLLWNLKCNFIFFQTFCLKFYSHTDWAPDVSQPRLRPLRLVLDLPDLPGVTAGDILYTLWMLPWKTSGNFKAMTYHRLEAKWRTLWRFRRLLQCMTLMTKSHSVVSAVDLASNFNFAILVLMTLLLASHMEVGSTSTTAGSCMLKNRAMSHNKSSWLRTWLSCCYFMRWHGTTCMQPTDKTRNSVDAFTGWDV